MKRDRGEAVENLIDDAWETPDLSRRAKFARKALALDPDAIDAYVALAFGVDTLAERIALLREAVRVGKAKWAPELKRPHKKFFWSDVDTRPFMRAVHNLSLALWERGARDEALALVEELLRINANDNQGVRYLALGWYPTRGNWRRVEELLRLYEGDTAIGYLYARCLNCVRLGSGAEIALVDAVKVNPYVPEKLVSRRASIDRTVQYVTVGSDEEAAGYAKLNREAWTSVPGALRWLRTASRDIGRRAE